MPERDPMGLSVDKLEQALAALGVAHFRDDERNVPYLVGVLLSIAELATVRHSGLAEVLDGGEPTQYVAMSDGYMSALVVATGGDVMSGARLWVMLMQDRLNRTSVDLDGSSAGPGRGELFTAVMSPALLVAANLLEGLNQEMGHDRVREMLGHAQHNLARVQEGMAALETGLRGQGVDLG